MRLSQAFKEKRAHYYSRHGKVILLHDNARPHIAAPVKTYLETLKQEVLPQPPYSPHIVPSDFHLFRSMTHGLSEQHFKSYENTKNWVDSWITSKDVAFFRRDIYRLALTQVEGRQWVHPSVCSTRGTSRFRSSRNGSLGTNLVQIEQHLVRGPDAGFQDIRELAMGALIHQRSVQLNQVNNSTIDTW